MLAATTPSFCFATEWRKYLGLKLPFSLKCPPKRTGVYPVHEAFVPKGMQVVLEIGPKRGISVDLCAGRARRSLAPPDIAYLSNYYCTSFTQC
jgi:hypothetical protein